MTRVLINGANGQLGLCLKDIQSHYEDMDIHFFTKDDWDVSSEQQTVDVIGRVQPDIIINTAAYTAVDRAEEEKELCHDVNVNGIRHILKALESYPAHLIHFSSDYVYHAERPTPLVEESECHPKGIYAQSKRDSELLIIKEATAATIFRTSWIYSAHGHNFVKTMIRLGKKLDVLKVVQDQWGCPTSAHDIAEMLFGGIQAGQFVSEGVRIFNYTQKGLTNWHEFARHIFDITNLDPKVYPVTTEDYNAPAPRPFWSVLNCSKFDDHFPIERSHWKDSLRRCLDKMH